MSGTSSITPISMVLHVGSSQITIVGHLFLLLNNMFHTFIINMGGCDVVLRENWSHILGLVTIYFKKIHTGINTNG